MALSVYSTLSGEKQEFIPLEEGKVRMYVCGLTVQERPHIGHMRAAMVADLIQRWLEHKGFEVIQIQNITDVDDKVIEKALREKRDYREIADENEREYLQACHDLGITKVHFYPRASQHVQQIISLIERLLEKGLAYQIDGDVYYEVSKFKDYGKLSRKKLDDLRVGARVAVDQRKRSPVDFALWKSAKEGEPWWESPWGRGRPGWHIECSAMSMHYLGETFDIHTGGADLIFPHHENEIAQSEGATGKPFARYWIHNEWVMLTGEKMSKSTGHFIPIVEVLHKYDPDVVRFYLLSTHYRSQIEFDEERLEGAESGFSRITTLIRSLKDKIRGVGKIAPVDPSSLSENERQFYQLVVSRCEDFEEAMDDDFNTPKALGAIFDVVKAANIELSELENRDLLFWTLNGMIALNQILGLCQEEDPTRDLSIEVAEDVGEKGNGDAEAAAVPTEKAAKSLKVHVDAEAKASPTLTVRKLTRTADAILVKKPPVDDIVKLIVEHRDELRSKKLWELADALRSRLKELGVTLEDRPDGTIWKLT